MTPLVVAEWALVKDGGQTVCRHIFDIATILRVFEHASGRAEPGLRVLPVVALDCWYSYSVEERNRFVFRTW